MFERTRSLSSASYSSKHTHIYRRRSSKREQAKTITWICNSRMHNAKFDHYYSQVVVILTSKLCVKFEYSTVNCCKHNGDVKLQIWSSELTTTTLRPYGIINSPSTICHKTIQSVHCMDAFGGKLYCCFSITCSSSWCVFVYVALSVRLPSPRALTR